MRVEIAPSALRQNVVDEVIEYACRNAVVIEDLENDLRLCLGADRSATLLKIVALRRGEDPELAIHATEMRPTYRRLLPGGR